jgi:hypothetical protein
MIMQSHNDTDRGSDDRIHDPIVDTPSDIVPLQRKDFVFGDLHPSRLAVAYEHLNIRFEASQFLQNLSLKIVIDHVNHDRNCGDVVA